MKLRIFIFFNDSFHSSKVSSSSSSYCKNDATLRFQNFKLIEAQQWVVAQNLIKSGVPVLPVCCMMLLLLASTTYSCYYSSFLSVFVVVCCCWFVDDTGVFLLRFCLS